MPTIERVCEDFLSLPDASGGLAPRLISRSADTGDMTHWTETLFKEQADRYADFFDERFAAAGPEVEQLLSLVDESFAIDPERTLDLACGTGRHVIALAEQGCTAEGLDFSEQFVAEARDRIDVQGLSDRASVIHHDMRALDDWPGAEYDLITSFWNSLGYYDRATDVQVLREARRLLSKDGCVAIELGNKDFYLPNFEDTSVEEDEDRLTIERRDYDVETGRFHTQVDLFDATDGYEHVDTMEWENRLYAPAVLRELIGDAGFKEVELFGGFSGSAVSMHCERVVAVAR
jgi:SAM-dependent methyltransferase